MAIPESDKDLSIRETIQSSGGQIPNKPFPDIVRPRPGVEEGGDGWDKSAVANPLKGNTDLKGYKITVPFRDDHISKIMRTHELANAKWSPERIVLTAEQEAMVRSFHPMAWAFAQDAILVHKLRSLHDSQHLPAPCYASKSDCLPCWELRKALAETLVDKILHKLPKHKAWRVAKLWSSVRFLNPMHLNDHASVYCITHVNTILAEPRPDIEKRILIAELMNLEYENAKKPSEKPKEQKTPTTTVGSKVSAPKGKGGAKDSDSERVSLPKGGRPGDSGILTGMPNWTQPRLLRPPMQFPKRVRSRAMKPSDQGGIPRFIHRLPMDGMIFAQKKKGEGATVLIDCSGSMSFSAEELRSLVTKFPTGTVAGYSGDKLVIFAEKGRMVHPSFIHDRPAEYRFSGNNESDGPALEWLAKQPGKKFWVSDQLVTELGDGCTARAVIYCQRIVHRARIQVVSKVGGLLLTNSELKNAKSIEEAIYLNEGKDEQAW